MGAQAAEEAYQVLVGWLRSNNLDWVADQIEDEVTLGKVRSERISVETDSQTKVGEVTRTSAEFVGRADYSAEEKFEMVTGAVRAIVVGGVLMQEALAKALGADEPSSEIQFVPGETGDIYHAYQPRDLDTRRVSIAQVEHLFAALTEDVKRAD